MHGKFQVQKLWKHQELEKKYLKKSKQTSDKQKIPITAVKVGSHNLDET